MSQVERMYSLIVEDIEKAGKKSHYTSDANEPDPRYKSYGVRAAGKKEIISKHKNSILLLTQNQQISLATKLMTSRYGEQQSVALFILEENLNYFDPGKFQKLDKLIRCIHGWSKVDSFTGLFLREILFNYPDEFIPLVRRWNKEKDIWLKRTSVVLFTRKVAKSGKFTFIALEMADHLKLNKEPLVLKGIGWLLKDLMKTDKERIFNRIKQWRKEGVSSILTLYAIKDLKGQEREEVLSIKYVKAKKKLTTTL